MAAGTQSKVSSSHASATGSNLLAAGVMARPPHTPAGTAAPTGLVLAGNRPAEVIAFEEEVVALFVSMADLLGIPKSVAAIYGIVFASPLPVSFADIDARLDFSKGSISQGLKLLREIGAIKEVSSAADRAELFEPDLELRRMVRRFLEQRVQKQIEAGEQRLAHLARSVPGGRSAGADLLRDRLRHLQGSHQRARKLLPIIQGFLRIGS